MPLLTGMIPFIARNTLIAIAAAYDVSSSPLWRMDQAIRSVELNCFHNTKSVPRFTPRFTRTPEDGEFTDSSVLRFADQVGDALATAFLEADPLVEEADPADLLFQAKKNYESLKSSAIRFSGTHRLNPFQRACLAECITESYYSRFSQNGEYTASFYQARGKGLEMSKLAVSIARALGLDANLGHSSYLHMVSGGKTYFARLRIDGRDFQLPFLRVDMDCGFYFDSEQSGHGFYDLRAGPDYPVELKKSYNVELRRQLIQQSRGAEKPCP